MPATTPNLGLTKDCEGEPYSLARVNANSDRIDTFAGEMRTALAAKQDTLTAAQQAAVDSGITAAKLTADEAALAEVVDAGAKNLFNATSGVQSVDGFTLTPNGDGSYTVEGTRTSSITVWMPLGSISLAGNYFLSGAASNSCRLTATVDGIAQYDFGGGVELNGVISNNVYVNIPTSVSSLSGVIVKPMICTKAAWDISHKFVPYCPSMQEMYQLILALQNGTRSAPALAKSAEPEVEPETGEEEMR